MALTRRNQSKISQEPEPSQSEKLLDGDMEIETNQAAETQAVSNITEIESVDESTPVQDKPVDSEKEPSQSEKLVADEIETNQATEIQAVSSTKSTEGDDKSEAVSQIAKKDASSSKVVPEVQVAEESTVSR